jgi:chromate transporter
VTAAVVGVIASLALWFALHVLFHQTQEIAGLQLPVLASPGLDHCRDCARGGDCHVRFKVGALPTLGLGALGGLATLVV